MYQKICFFNCGILLVLILRAKMKYEVYTLSFRIVGLSIFGQAVLWFGQAKYTLYLSEGTSELKRKFLALQLYKYLSFFYCHVLGNVK